MYISTTCFYQWISFQLSFKHFPHSMLVRKKQLRFAEQSQSTSLSRSEKSFEEIKITFARLNIFNNEFAIETD